MKNKRENGMKFETAIVGNLTGCKEIKRTREVQKGTSGRPTRDWKHLLACDTTHQ